MKSNNYGTVAAFGCNTSRLSDRWVEVASSYFAAARAEPDTMAIVMKGKSHVAPFEGFAALAQMLSDSRISSVNIYYTIPHYRQLVFGYFCGAELWPSRQIAVLSVAEQLMPFANTGTYLCRLGSELLAEYAIGYLRPLLKGPTLYAYGMAAGLAYEGEERREAQAIARWRQDLANSRRFANGHLRDVYPYSLLSRHHLEADVSGRKLSEWLAENSARGSLEPCDPSRWCWTVPENSVSHVRAQLVQSNLIIGSDPQRQNASPNLE